MVRTHCDCCDSAATPDEPVMTGRYWDVSTSAGTAKRDMGVRMRVEFQTKSGDYHEYNSIEICDTCANQMIEAFRNGEQHRS